LQGLGETFLSNLFSFIAQSGISNILQALKNAVATKSFKISKIQALSIDQLLNMFIDLSSRSAPQWCLEKLLERANYEDFLHKEYPSQEARERMDNVYELIKATQRFEDKYSRQAGNQDSDNSANVLEYLQEVSLMEDHHEATDSNPVLIMTMHGAKGLEFDHVFIPAIEEGIIPYQRAEQSELQIQEECRLFYVGITRAKKHLILTYAQSRNHFGKRFSSQLSRFLDNHPKDLIQSMYCHNTYITSKMLSNWLCGQGIPSNSGDAMNTKNLYANFIPNKNSKDAAAKTIAPTKNVINPVKTLSKNIVPAVHSRTFRKGTLVRHDKFGLGVVHAAQKQTNGQLCLTVAFGKEHKKVLSTFLHTVRP
jgi:hypothetical protein